MIRPNADDGIVDPSTQLHRVESVTDGERLVCVGWIQSRIRSRGQRERERLCELVTPHHALFAWEGKGELFDLLGKSCTNPMRSWGGGADRGRDVRGCATGHRGVCHSFGAIGRSNGQ